jgi:hypothetical protein
VIEERNQGEKISTDKAALPPAKLGRELLRGVREGWDRLGMVLAVSLTWTFLLFAALWMGALLSFALPGLIGMALGALVVMGILCGPSAGVFHLAHKTGAREEVSYLDFWRGAIKLWRPAFVLGLTHLLVGTLFIANLSFYMSLRNVAGTAATVLCLYTLLFWLMMAVYHLPLLVAQEAGLFDEEGKPARRGTFAVLRRAFYLAFGTPFFTLGLLLTLLLVTALLMATGVAAALLWAGWLPLLITYPTRALLIRYGVLPAPVIKEVVPDEKFRIKN